MLPAPKARRSIRQPLHLTITELMVGLVLLATLAVWIPTYRNTHAAGAELSGRLTPGVARETVERSRSHLSAAVPAPDLLRDLLKADARYGVDPPRSAAEDDVWEGRARLCLQVLTTHPGFS